VSPEVGHEEGQREEHVELARLVGLADGQVGQQRAHAHDERDHAEAEDRVPHEAAALRLVDVHIQQLVLVHHVGQEEEQRAERHQKRGDLTRRKFNQKKHFVTMHQYW
jgi:hypothetical protein